MPLQSGIVIGWQPFAACESIGIEPKNMRRIGSIVSCLVNSETRILGQMLRTKSERRRRRIRTADDIFDDWNQAESLEMKQSGSNEEDVFIILRLTWRPGNRARLDDVGVDEERRLDGDMRLLNDDDAPRWGSDFTWQHKTTAIPLQPTPLSSS